MARVQADYVFHPPCGSNVPGKVEANPYVFYPPDELRKLVETEKDKEKLEKIKSALRQWERLYVYPGYPYRAAYALRKAALNLLAAVNHPSQNIPYYQDAEVSEGLESILKSLENVHDNYDAVRFDYNRQGERPGVDIDTARGDFLSPSEPPIGDTVKTKGEGPNPDIIYPFPPTGGTLDKI